MTRGESDKLDIFIGEFREFRVDDRDWKRETDKRLEVVEGFVTGALAERRVAARARFTRRERIGMVIAVASFVVGTIVQVYSLLT